MKKLPASHRILVVDDEEKIRKSLSGLLQDNGYDVVTAKNGAECLQTMSSQDFDLVILDIVMPEMSGIETLHGIKERYKDTEVIMITGYADKEKAIAAFRLNAYDFIEKPFDSSEILNTIAHCLTQLSLRKDIEKKSQELRESEKKYRQLFETLQEGIWVIDKDSHTTLVNPRMTEMLGYTEREMLGKHLFSFMDEHGVEIAKRYLERRQQGIKERHDFEFIRKDGSRIYTSLETAPITDEKGNYVGAIATVQDITDRKKAEEALKESEERYRDLFESANDLIQIVTPDGHFLYVNRAWRETLGYNEEEIASLSLFDIIHPDSQAHCKPLFQRVMSGEKVDEVEAEIVARDGRKIVVVGSARCRFIGDKAVYGQCIFHDITERKQAEEFIRDIFESISDELAVIDRDYRIITANRAYYKHADMTIEDIRGKHCYKVTHHRDKPCYGSGEDCAVKHTFETGESHTVVHKHYDREGGLLYVEIRSYPLKDSSGKAISAIEIINDITEKKKLEDQLRHAQKMETVGTLAGGIAHDFNNILTAMIGYEHILQMEMRKDDPLKVYVDRIRSLAERAANLTQGLLAFSRKQVINLQPVNLNEIIKRLEGILSRVIGEDIKLEIILTDKELTVMADSSQIEQVLMNLCTNARDAMPDGGLLSIRTELVKLDNDFIKTHGYGKAGMFARISVTDTGHGMDEETRRRIFEPFFTTKEVGKGTGLGLAIVYGIVKQHNGCISVYSTPGKGTTFTIYLPAIKADVKETRLAELVAPAGGTETVLVAEDYAEVRKLTKSILEGFGYAVIEALDGEDAINKFIENKDRIQLLLFDLIMPKKSGKVVYEEIRKIRPDIKTLFTSGYDMDIIQKIGIFEEGLNFVLKPFSPNELLRKVRDVLDK